VIMTPRVRKFALVTHVTSSVGWLGSIAGFLVLAIAGVNSQDAQTVQAAYLASELITRWVIVPLAYASLLTGLIVSLGTSWGLFRHYWVLAKLLITILATLLLLLHTRPIGVLADVARGTMVSSPGVGQLQRQLVGDAVAALLALLVNVTLSVYKPRGLTPYGLRKLREERDASQSLPDALLSDGTPRWVKVFGILILIFIVLFAGRHLTGGHGVGGHGPGLHGH
jgi:hypothetical protein